MANQAGDQDGEQGNSQTALRQSAVRRRIPENKPQEDPRIGRRPARTAATGAPGVQALGRGLQEFGRGVEGEKKCVKHFQERNKTPAPPVPLGAAAEVREREEGTPATEPFLRLPKRIRTEGSE